MRIMQHELPSRRPAVQRLQNADQLWRVDLIRSAMTVTGMTQKQLAHAIGIHDAHVCRWLKGVRPVPDHWVPSIISLLEGAA